MTTGPHDETGDGPAIPAIPAVPAIPEIPAIRAVPAIRAARFAELDAPTLYALLRLRVDVFVVEQRCPYPELDGRDAEPGTAHLWTADAAGPTAYLRVLREADGVRIGRVCTRADARGAGLAARLVAAAVRRHGSGPVVLDAQAYLVGFYARHGFRATGPEFVEDGIAHVPMARAGGPPGPAGPPG